MKKRRCSVKKSYKIKFIPIVQIYKMKFQELQELGFINKSYLEGHSIELLSRLNFVMLRELGVIRESKVKYNQIKEQLMDYVGRGFLLKEAKYYVSERFNVSRNSMAHILYGKIKK